MRKLTNAIGGSRVDLLIITKHWTVYTNHFHILLLPKIWKYYWRNFVFNLSPDYKRKTDLCAVFDRVIFITKTTLTRTCISDWHLEGMSGQCSPGYLVSMFNFSRDQKCDADFLFKLNIFQIVCGYLILWAVSTESIPPSKHYIITYIHMLSHH